MRVIVTGGAGYIGSFAVERLIEAGHDVTVLDSLWRGHRGGVSDAAQLIAVDITDAKATRDVVAKVRPTRFFTMPRRQLCLNPSLIPVSTSRSMSWGATISFEQPLRPTATNSC